MYWQKVPKHRNKERPGHNQKWFTQIRFVKGNRVNQSVFKEVRSNQRCSGKAKKQVWVGLGDGSKQNYCLTQLKN